VIANEPPVCQAVTAATLEDTPVDILLLASDPENDPLVYVITGGPSHGTVSLNGNVATYRPDPNYCGPDSFTFKAVDPAGLESSPCIVTIDVTGVPDAPVCSANTRATVCEDQPIQIILPAADPDVDSCLPETLTIVVVRAPANGTVTIAGDVATYQGNLNYNGPDSFTFQVTDMYGLMSGVCTVAITVMPGNDSPVGVIAVRPTLDLGPTVPGVNVVSPNNIGACVTLDATQSSDVDNDFSDLSFTWLVDGVVVGTGPVVSDVCVLVGDNTVTLIVNDGTSATGACDKPATSETVQMVTVLTRMEACEEMILQIYDSTIERKNKQPFIASLKNAGAAFERGSCGAGINMLEALIHKFEAQLKHDPDLQAQWIRQVRSIMEGLCEPLKCEGCAETE
jgi:hypothetical protein